MSFVPGPDDDGVDRLRGKCAHPRSQTMSASRASDSRLRGTVERVAPGFRSLIRGRHTAGPPDLQRRNPNLVEGAINGGTAAVHQQLVFRPVPGLGRADTPVDGLFLAGSSAHPGGAVHGGAGANAARAALAAGGPAGPVYRWAVRAAHRRLYR